MAEKIELKGVLSRMRSMWIVCLGLIMLLVMSGRFVGYVLEPYLAFLLMFGVVAYGNHNLQTSSVNCSLITHYTFFTLFFSGLIMLLLNLLNTRMISDTLVNFSHDEIPFHASVIVFPVSTVCFGIALLRRGKPEYCNACKAASGFSVIKSLQRNLLHRESEIQIIFAFVLSLVLSVFVLVYYIVIYNNDMVSLVDKLVLYFVPVGVYIVSVIYFVVRYSSINNEIPLSLKIKVTERSQLVRFMIIKGDEVYLHERARSAEFGLSLWDTPLMSGFDYAHEVTLDRARRVFEDATGLTDFNIRFLFNTNASNQTVHHFAVFLPEESPDPQVQGQWFNLYAFDKMLKAGLITRSFAYEMHRIFTITMAWKTYSRDGKRLYPIKNYRPTFRLRDFKNWDVDYSDLSWISVAENNEDHPLFRLRQFWRQHISGVDRRWRRGNS